MAWFYATSVSVTNGATVVSVNAGDDIALAQGAGGLVIGTQPPVEIKRTYLDGSSNKKIELLKPWPYGSQTNQAAVAFPTDGDLAAATAVLKQLIESFSLATQAEAQAGTDNTKPMTPLRVKQAMDALLGSASKLTATTSATDTVQGRAMRSGDYGAGAVSGLVETDPSAVRQNRFMATSATWPTSPMWGTDAANQGQLLQMQHGDPTYAVQLFHSLSATVGDLVRRISNNVVGPWVRNITSANMVGTVAASGGSPSLFSAIIERGSNANGEYVKFADGTMICWATPLVVATTLNNANVGSFGWSYYSDNNLVNFPATFSSAPSVACTPQGAFLSAANTNLTAGSFLLIPITSILVSNPSPMMFIAVGRWR